MPDLLLNLARFDLVSIRLALACCRLGSLSAAAQATHVAIAPASRRLRELEQHLGTPLFERHARGLSPTPAGDVFARHAADLLQTMERMGSEIADLQQGIGCSVRLCSSTAAIHQFLPPLLARYRQVAPQVRVDLEEQVSRVVAATVRDRRADIGIFVEGTVADGLDVHPFASDELVLVASRRHRLARGQGPIAFSDTLDEDYVGLTTGAAVLERQLQAAVVAGKTLRLRMQVRSLDASCQMVAHGLGIALLPLGTVRPWIDSLQLATRPLADAWARRRVLIATRAGETDPAVRALLAFLVAARTECSRPATAGGRK